jgi:predicted  nucleic acid-binding Zn-ribbon protein
MLRIRHLLLSVNTDKGAFGTKRSFRDGLNVIRAENWAGKSILVQSIIYALGLEGMFGPSQDVPLPYAVTDYLDFKDGRASVLDSMVSLEIENGDGKFLTIQRGIAGERNRHLVTVYEGRAITMKEALETRRDYFVRERYAATSERGFHAKLADFLGWSLPMAPRHDDEDCPLYLETIFPLFYVEQKLGWGRIPAKYPTYLGIRDVGRRTVEFLLGLDAYAIAVERAAVQAEIARIRTAWTTLRTQTAKLASAAAGLINAIPTDPVSSWPPEISPEIMMAVGREWLALPPYLATLPQRLAELNNQPVPSSESVQPRARAELMEAESQLADRERVVSSLVEKIDTDGSQVAALRQRIDSIQDDLRKYKDVRRLRKLGSPDEPETANGACPTCHQELSDSLLDLSKKAAPMSVEQNVSFYEEQVQLFTAVLMNTESSFQANEVQLQSHRSEIEKLRERIRALRETLIAPSNTPSIETLTERIRLDNRVQNLENVLANFEDSLSEFAQLAAEWKDVQERRARLPKGALSTNDENKVGTLEASFRRQLVLYKMGSVNPQELNISRANYEPEIAGLNLGADVSGSDLIRLQWAYLLALLEIGLSGPTNHPGLLIMDEPQQQSVEESAFLAMLEYAANFKKSQVIIATSHERHSIGDFLKGIGVNGVDEYEDARIIDRL